MKKIFLYVPDGDGMTVESVVIWLRVGMAKRDQTKLSLLESFALDCGSFLRVRDEDTRYWLDAHSKRLFPDSRVPSMHFLSAMMDINQAYRMTIDGTLEDYVRNKKLPKGTLQLLFHLDSNFMRKITKNPCNTMCPSGKRKYLSHDLSVSSLVMVSPALLMITFGIVDRLGEILLNLIIK